MTAGSPLRTLVVEDEWPARNYLVELLESSQLAEVVGAVGAVDEARQALASDLPGVGLDVVFVDVALQGADSEENGLSLVRSVAGAPNAPMFVLATAYEQHALEAFELGVVDYLLKPFSEERVVQCLRRLHERRAPLGKGPVGPPRIVARRKRALVFLEPHEIWAFEAADRLTFVHSLPGVFDTNCRLEVPSPFATTCALRPMPVMPLSAVARVPSVLSVGPIPISTGALLPIWMVMEPESVSLVFAIPVRVPDEVVEAVLPEPSVPAEPV